MNVQTKNAGDAGKAAGNAAAAADAASATPDGTAATTNATAMMTNAATAATTANVASASEGGNKGTAEAAKGSSQDSNKGAGQGSGKTAFKQTLTLFDLIVCGLVMLVPLSPFSLYGNIFAESNGMPALSYLIGMLCVIPTTLSFGVMIRKWPSSGSVFTYCFNGIGKIFGFVVGWMFLLQYLVYPDLMYMLAGHALNQIVPEMPIWGWAIAIMAFVTVISLLKMKATVYVNRAALVGELIVFGLFVFFALRHIVGGVPLDMHAAGSLVSNSEGFDVMGVMEAVALSMLSYLGFGSIATLTQESKRPKVDPPRATFLVILIVGVIFVVINLLAQLVDPTGSLFVHDKAGGFYVVAAAVGGAWFGTLCAVSLALAMGVFSGLMDVVSVSRVIYIMGNANALPKVFDKINPKTNIPTRATVFVAIFSLAALFLIMPLGIDKATDINNFAALSTYFMVNVTVVWYCWIKGHNRSNVFRMLILPGIGAIAIAAVMFSMSPLAIVVDMIWCCLGIGIYFVITRAMHKSIDLG